MLVARIAFTEPGKPSVYLLKLFCQSINDWLTKGGICPTNKLQHYDY